LIIYFNDELTIFTYPCYPNEKLNRGVLDAITAEPVELKQVTFDVESTFLRQLFLHLDKATTGKIYNFTTTGAN
jgi:hypothetical protein